MPNIFSSKDVFGVIVDEKESQKEHADKVMKSVCSKISMLKNRGCQFMG